MKKTLIGLVMCVMAGSALAETPQGSAPLCAVLGEIAENVMIARQNGAALSEMMTVADAAGDDTSARQLLTEIILAAYETPRFSVEGNQRRAAQDHRAMVETTCYRAAGG